ncbi:MAG: hypothetical protein ACRDYU_09505 [Actinomycetes bacterium]
MTAADRPSVAQDSLDGAFADVARTLAADGYQAEWRLNEQGAVDFWVTASEEACAECLVPMPVMQAILEGALEGTGRELGRIEMPAEH